MSWTRNVTLSAFSVVRHNALLNHELSEFSAIFGEYYNMKTKSSQMFLNVDCELETARAQTHYFCGQLFFQRRQYDESNYHGLIF